jgi:hyperosmotically inducible protein
MRKTLLATMLVLGFASVTSAQAHTNMELFRDVSTQINRYVHFTIFDSVSANVDDGFVTLSGKVTMPYKASDLEKRVARVEGVRGVQNNIEVLPVSSFDDRLRVGIARALYSHPALSIYARGVAPPIHVIVEHGRVTLVGVVNNEMDKTIANSVARSFLAFDVKNELKTNSEMTRQLEEL